MSVNETQTRVAVMAATEQNQHHLSTLLGEAGLDVVMHEAAGDDFLRQLEQTPADVLLVDLCDDTDSEIEVIQTLLEYDALPVLFNDSTKSGGETNSLWAKKLAHKLVKMAQDFEPELEPEPVQKTEPEVQPNDKPEPGANLELEPTSTISIGLDFEGEPELIAQPQQVEPAVAAVKTEPSFEELAEGAAKNVWVLGASLGGPQAVRQFLLAVKPDLPVAFILAQHIGANHISLLAEQLDRISQFKVFPGYSGHMIRQHEVILAPAGKQIRITQDGYIALSEEPPDTIYSPCINDVITAVAKRYGNMAGTIVFSGMGDDGAIGCQSMAEHGGIVWAQDVDSCVISSMPDQARKTNNVTFSANPQKLADELYEYYSE